MGIASVVNSWRLGSYSDGAPKFSREPRERRSKGRRCFDVLNS